MAGSGDQYGGVFDRIVSGSVRRRDDLYGVSGLSDVGSVDDAGVDFVLLNVIEHLPHVRAVDQAGGDGGSEVKRFERLHGVLACGDGAGLADRQLFDVRIGEVGEGFGRVGIGGGRDQDERVCCDDPAAGGISLAGLDELIGLFSGGGDECVNWMPCSI